MQPNPYPNPNSNLNHCFFRYLPVIKLGLNKKGMSREFEEYVRSCMATGCSARHNRDILRFTIDFILGLDEGSKLKAQVPKLNWFRLQREAMGLQSYVYVLIQVAGCDDIVQWGFDETSLDGQSCFNQWCLLRTNGVVKLVTLECCGLLPSSTADETIDHIKDTWQRGKNVIDMLREQLGPDLKDTHVPLNNGGVAIHKIFGLMHDTCNTANRVAELMAELRDDSGRVNFGDEDWDAAGNKAKTMFDFLCGNHTRNLLVGRYEKHYDTWLEKELGDQLRAARAATGGRARLECSGNMFLRALCKLTHRGYAQYVKGLLP